MRNRFLILILILPGFFAWGQNDDELEALYDQYETQEVQRKAKVTPQKQAPTEEPASLSDLSNLAPFKDVAVIQRRFLPRTGRFELSAAGLVSTNNQFFNNIGLGLKGAYYFTEKYAIEGSYLFLSSSEKDVTKGLKDQQIQTQSLVEPEGYMGLAFKWSPVYGKMAWFQEKIIPFDIYFAPGIGLTSTALGEDEMTFSLSAGQSFSLTKSSAIRWDVIWNFYDASVQVTSGGQTVTESRSQDDLLIMLGYSFYIPEATYR